jgi:hypothetical protein
VLKSERMEEGMCGRKLAGGAFVSICLCAIFVSAMLLEAQALNVGVSLGNTFVYDRTAVFTSDNGGLPSPDLLEINQTSYIQVDITEVNGVVISSNVFTHFKNGTQLGGNVTCNIETGETTGGPPFIESNLGPNSLVNPAASEPWAINETVTRTYKDSTRETNHLRFEFNGTSDYVGEYTSVYDYWFDKSTGACVEYTSEFINYGATTIVSSKLISTNLWQTSEKLPSNSGENNTLVVPAIAAVIVVVVIVAALVVFRKRRTNKPTETTEQVEQETAETKPVKLKSKTAKKER